MKSRNSREKKTLPRESNIFGHFRCQIVLEILHLCQKILIHIDCSVDDTTKKVLISRIIYG